MESRFSLPGFVAFLVVLLVSGRASMNEQRVSTGQEPQKVTRPREEFEKLAITKVRGEMPETLRGVWLEVPIYRVEVTVDAQGNVIAAYPLYGNSLLAEAAVASAKKWKFPPQRVNGRPVQIVSAVNVEFQDLEAEVRLGLIRVGERNLQEHPDSAVAHLNLGFAYKSVSRYEEAAEQFGRAIELTPNWGVAHIEMGETHFKMERYHIALESFIRATKLQPDYHEAYVMMGACYVRLNRDVEALEAFLHAADTAKSSRDNIATYRNLVTCYESLGKRAEAAQAQMQVAQHAARYSAVTQRSPIDASEESFSAAVKYERVDDKEKALAAYRLAMETDPLSEPGLLARIVVAGYLRRSGQRDQATALLNEMVRMTDEAIQDYESSKNEEGLGNAYYWRGSARRELGQLDSAVGDLRKAVKYKPGWGKARLRLAYAYLEAGDFHSARTEYRRSGIVDEVFVRKLDGQAK